MRHLRAISCCAASLGMVISVAVCGCNSTAASGPLDHALDGQSAAIEAVGGQMEIHLDFARTDLTDEDLATLPLPATATSIDLSYTKVTDAGLVHLKRLKQLEKLRIAGTEISDAGLATLKELDALWSVDADQSQISRKGQLELIKFLAPRARAQAIERTPSAS